MALTPGLRTVTLVTGDHVQVSHDGHTIVVAGPNRDAIRFDTLRTAGHTFVIPSDATTLLRNGQLDPRLFDVTQLLAFDYDKLPDLPVIVQGSGGAGIAAASAGKAASAVAPRALNELDIVALRAPVDGTFWQTLTRSPSALNVGAGTKVWLDGLRRLYLDQSVPQIGGDVAHELGFDGSGVKVGIVDTGVDWEHPDLADRVLEHINFVADRDVDELDRVGHGTHVASIIAGTGAASNGRYRGVAPGAKLLVAKVCEDVGCPESAIIAGMLWTVQQGAKVVNVSLGGDDAPGIDPIESTVNSLSSKYNALFVVAAGNGGPGWRVGSPASADAALAVGAVDKQDALAPFSQSGPRLEDAAFKPEISAPGVAIVAAKSQYGTLQGEEAEDLGQYTQLSGTSMATPHVVGSAAIAFQRHPDWSAQQIKALLVNASHTIDGVTLRGQGAGRVDIANATKLQLISEPAAISFGLPRWPHDDDEVVEKLVTFDNTSDDALTIDLSLDATGPDDAAAPPEMFVLSARRLTIAAHDRASVTLTGSSRFGADGATVGRIVATSGETRMHVPFVVEREVESYDLTLQHLNRQGSPASSDTVWTTISGDGSDFAEFMPLNIDASGVAKVRKPRGTYVVSAGFFDPAGTPTPPFGEILPYALLLDPSFELSSNQTIVLDARDAQPVTAVGPTEDATLATLGLMYRFGPGGNQGRGSWQSGAELFTARIGTGAIEDPSTTVFASWRDCYLEQPTSYLIGGAWFIHGDLVSGFNKTTHLDEFAKVQTHFASDGSSAPGKLALYAIAPDDEFGYGLGGSGIQLPPLPATIDVYYHAATPGQRWDTVFGQGNWLDATGNQFQSRPREFTPGDALEETWNQGVFGPSGAGYVQRYQDQLAISPDWYSDREGRLAAVSLGKAHMRLLADGELIGEEDYDAVVFNVKPERARYRVELDVERSADATLSTRVSLAWELVSERPAADEFATLPVMGVRFLPELDLQNTAAESGAVSIPIVIGHPEALPAAQVEALTVDVSFDDGATWREAEVSGSGDSWTAAIEHPEQSGFVSLRASVIDADDNLAEQTIIRAYRLP